MKSSHLPSRGTSQDPTGPHSIGCSFNILFVLAVTSVMGPTLQLNNRMCCQLPPKRVLRSFPSFSIEPNTNNVFLFFVGLQHFFVLWNQKHCSFRVADRDAKGTMFLDRNMPQCQIHEIFKLAITPGHVAWTLGSFKSIHFPSRGAS